MTDQEFQQFLRTLQQQMSWMERQIVRVRQTAAGLQAESILRAVDQKPRMPIEFKSQYGEDVLAWTLLQHKTTGFFIEAGAFDGYHYSTTYALEAMGWNGLLVEAIPQRSQECTRRRPHSRVVNAVLSSAGASGEAQFSVVQDPYGGMLSYTARTERPANVPADAPTTTVSVPRATLDGLLVDHRGPIDLVVLDMEGDELSALNGFDLDRFRPRILMVEDNSGGRDKENPEFMQKHGYRYAMLQAVNQVFIRDEDAEIFEELKWMTMV